MEASKQVQIFTEPLTSAACPKCGAMLEAPDIPAFTMVQCPTCDFEFPMPARFGSFVLLQILGMGGMGGVYRARDEALNREVAIKVMLKSLGDDPQFVATFQREAQAAAKLNHSNIGQIYSFGQVLGQPYIAMELISGGSLDKMMASQGALDPGVVFHIGIQIAEGLGEAADAGLVHGDVKPENILFDAEKNAKLVDFGLAAMQSGGPNQEVWGTPYYIAPEKVRKQKTDFRADIYSLGATLYHAIAGVPPFDGPDAAAVVKARFAGDPKPLRSIRGSAVPEEVDNIILRMLAVDPINRYPTYESLLGDMRRYLSKVGPVNVASSGKKIMIKGKRPKPSAPSFGVNGEPLPEGMVPVTDLFDQEESEREGRRRGRKILGLVFLGILLLAGAITGGFFWIRHSLDQKREKAERAQAAKSQEAANASIAKSVAEAKKLAERNSASVPEAMKYANDAAAAVVAVLGEDVKAWMIPPEPSYDVKLPASPAAKTNAADAAKTNAVANAANEDAKPAEAAEGQANATETVAENAAAGDAASEEAKNQPVVKMVREMFTDAYAVKTASALADAYIKEIEALKKIADTLQSPENEKALIAQANAVYEKATAMGNTTTLLESTRTVARMKKTLETVRAEIRRVELDRQTAAKEKEAAAKEAAIKEAQRQKEEAEKEKTETEITAVREKEKEIIPMLRQLQIRDATRQLKTLESTFTTTGGLDALTTAMKRIQRIEDFHKYLVEKTPGFKSSRGWSVETADAKTITVGGKKVPWADIFGSRMDIVAELVNGLAMNTKATKDMRLRERTTLETNAALCLTLFYSDIPAAVERAKQIARQAAENFEADADTVKQLMPEFFD